MQPTTRGSFKCCGSIIQRYKNTVVRHIFWHARHRRQTGGARPQATASLSLWTPSHYQLRVMSRRCEKPIPTRRLSCLAIISSLCFDRPPRSRVSPRECHSQPARRASAHAAIPTTPSRLLVSDTSRTTVTQRTNHKVFMTRTRQQTQTSKTMKILKWS